MNFVIPISFEEMYFPDKMPVNGISNDNTWVNATPVWPKSNMTISSHDVISYETDRLAQSYALIEALFDSIVRMNDDDAAMAIDRIRLEIDEERSARGM